MKKIPSAKAKPRDSALRDAIDLVGGVARLSGMLGVSSQAISQWDRCPATRVLAVETATEGKVTRHRLRPDIYPEPGAGHAPPPPKPPRLGARGALTGVVERLGGARVLTVGDIMLDRFVHGSVDRISPEAPIPVLRIDRSTAMLGGAGNVVRNLTGLGAGTVFVAAVGTDQAGGEVRALLDVLVNAKAELVETPGRQTAVKTRYLAGNQQLMRADEETTAPLDGAHAQAVIDTAVRAMDGCHVVVLSDYGKGTLGGGIAARIIAHARAKGLAVIVDPKGSDYTRYRGASLLTPNRKELAEATGMATDSDEAVIGACRHLIASADVEAVLATRSQQGMTLVPAGGAPVHLAAEAREVFDVSGAGDTVIATVAAALAVGAQPAQAAELANIAAGIVVGKVGTAVVHPADLRGALHQAAVHSTDAKVVPLEVALDRVQAWQARGERVGFTNGCFDLIHPGHVSLLNQARAACDRLVVAINSDASVRRLKGEGRPVQNETARAIVLASLGVVDLVLVFEEDTPIPLLQALKPDVLIKGADYSLDQVVGGDVVRAYGGTVMLARLVDGHSTTGTIAKLTG